MFADNARRLAGYAGAVLHELAAIFEVLAGDRPVPSGADDIARLMEVFPDG
jgi:hypothetical protein